jgi:chemotaxis signal transduction protein
LRRLGKKTTVTAPVSKNKFFVLQSKRENYKIAFIVDKFAEMITLTSGDVEFSAADFESSFPTFFGRASHKSQTVFLLDPETLFSSLSTADY